MFGRLVKAVCSIESFINEQTGNTFMLDERLGYIHSCPTNLGTGMRASVHIELPGWKKEGTCELQRRCTELSLHCREVNDESESEHNGVYDISNKNRLGYSEVEIIQGIINGINELYEKDVELQTKYGRTASITRILPKLSLLL